MFWVVGIHSLKFYVILVFFFTKTVKKTEFFYNQVPFYFSVQSTLHVYHCSVISTCSAFGMVSL